MKVSRLKLPRPALEFLASQGFEELYPPQAECVRAGLLRGKSVMVSAPTASGKTLVATLAILAHLSRGGGGGGGGKVVYLSPLRALAAEKFSEFKRMEKIDLGGKRIRVAISTGDFDGIERRLASSDVLVMTNEKMDSLIRNDAGWAGSVGLVITDEVHLMGDPHRGPTLEMVLTRLKRLDPGPQMVGLSATVTNSGEIAEWLGCRLVESGWRPVPLTEGVCSEGTVVMNDGRTFEVEPTVMGLPVDLGVQSVREGGQSLLFATTRPRSMSLATKACKAVSALLTPEEARSLEGISKRILDGNEHTKLVMRLAELVRQGAAFHHAGLSQSCREAVESGFRTHAIKLVSSTPTLAAGVNLPARRVVIASVSRYDVRYGGNLPISVLEYKQLCGRAGRPQYDDHGESVIVAGGLPGDELADRYIGGEPEPVMSHIINDGSLRIHVLSAIVINPGLRKGEVLDLFSETLGGSRSSGTELEFLIDDTLRYLLEEGLLKGRGERYAATGFGKKTSRLYIDPATAIRFKRSLEGASRKKGHTLGFLHLISDCDEFFPKLGLRGADHERVALLLENRSGELLEPLYGEDCNRSLLALHAWITESSELSMSDNLGVESGDMHRMAETGDWLLHCLRELARECDRADLLGELGVLRTRLAYGIRGELVDLVRVRGIGRVRARALHRHGIRDRAALARIPADRLAKVGKIGAALASNIKSQLKRGV